MSPEDLRNIELEKISQELEFRMAVTTAMLSTLDLEQVLYVILCGITSGDGLRFNRAFLFLNDDSGRALKITIAVGPPSQEAALKIWDEINQSKLKLSDLLIHYESYRNDAAAHELTRQMSGFQLPLQTLSALATSPQALMVEGRAPLSGVMASCLLNRSPFASNALTLMQEVGGAGGELMEFQKAAIVPLYVADKIIGVILADNFYSGDDVGSDDLRQLHALGNLAALAIDRARLHAQTVAMAEVDGLTGVYNRRYYQQELDRHLDLSRRSKQTLSIVVFDLDHFKTYNDTYGHLVGDQILKDVADLLSQNIRQSDMIARYGGEEFVVLLSDTSPTLASQVAEKLCTVVKEATLADKQIRGLTLSAGVACTEGFESAEELFERADRALYRAKKNGRDRVVVWSEPETS